MTEPVESKLTSNVFTDIYFEIRRKKTSGINVKHFVELNWTYLIKGNRASHLYFF